MFVDACRSDPFDGNKGPPDPRIETKSETAPLVPDAAGGLVAFFSCSTGQLSCESDKLRHGIFFHHVIEGLKGGPKDAPISRKGQVTVPLLEDYQHGAVPVAVQKDRDDRGLRQVPGRVGRPRGQGVLAVVGGAADTAQEPKAGEGRAFEIADGVKMRFCWIPPGECQLGSPEAGRV